MTQDAGSDLSRLGAPAWCRKVVHMGTVAELALLFGLVLWLVLRIGPDRARDLLAAGRVTVTR